MKKTGPQTVRPAAVNLFMAGRRARRQLASGDGFAYR
jgi:hypothetical protein